MNSRSINIARLKATSRKAISLLLCCSLTLGATAPAIAANHPNSSIENVNIINLVANVDWDYDKQAPVQVGEPAEGSQPLVLDKPRIVEILREAARSMYLMTEGKHRVGKVFVYKNSRFGDNVDIKILNKDGRSNASPGGWNREIGSSTNYLAMSGRAESLKGFSQVIAHEMGHYVYSI